MIDDESLLRSFEDGTLPAGSFHHREHVRLAWLYLRRHEVLDALGRFRAGLKRSAAANGRADLYHETITWAYVLLINERMRRGGGGEAEWEEFAAENGDLLDWKRNILAEYYGEQTLGSAFAREVFVMPDRVTKQKGAP